MAVIISNKALKLKLNPTTSQYSQFLKSFGCERFVYNFYLAEKNSFYEKEIKPLGNDKKARNAVWKTFEETPLADLKKQYPFLKEADSQDIAWSTFVGKLEQKAQYKNCQIVKIDKFFASSQLCNCCGFKNPDVQKFHLENWKCPQCGKEHQRDENAAVNIKAEAIKVLRGAEENQEKTCSKKNKLSKDTDSVLSTSELANLALSCAQ